MTETPSYLAWALLGLGAEVGEAQGMVEKSLRWNEELSVDELEKELGDVMFFLAATANAAGISLDDVLHGNMSKVNERWDNGYYETTKED